jgi:hypothetical protein
MPTCVSLTIAMQIPCFVYTVILHVAVWCIIHRIVAIQFHKNLIMHFYSICLVSTTFCDVRHHLTTVEHKCNTNIQELHTLPNTYTLDTNNILSQYSYIPIATTTWHQSQLVMFFGFKLISYVFSNMLSIQ